MSGLDVALVYKTKATSYKEFRNAHGFHHLIWSFVEDEFLPKLDFSRQILGDMSEVWNLSEDDRLTSSQKLVLSSSFDRAYCPVDCLSEFAVELRRFGEAVGEKYPDRVNHLAGIAECFEEIADKHDYRLIGVAVSPFDMYSEDDFIGKAWPFAFNRSDDSTGDS